MFLLGFSFSNQISLGTVVAIMVFAIGGVGIYYRLRGLRSSELEESANFWREQVEPLKTIIAEQREQIDKVSVERDEQRAAKHEALTALAAEKLKTDLTTVIKQVADTQNQIITRVEMAERNGVAALTAVVEGVETRMSRQFETLSSHQEMATETMQGLLHAVSDLNKKIAGARQ